MDKNDWIMDALSSCSKPVHPSNQKGKTEGKESPWGHFSILSWGASERQARFTRKA
jgi:hypothetical protein